MRSCASCGAQGMFRCAVSELDASLPRATRPWGVAILTGAAMTGFAANSVLARAALGWGYADAPTFTLVRIATGALVLGALARRPSLVAVGEAGSVRAAPPAGDWIAAAALFAYAGAFSYAYLQLPAGTGALILFGTVQATMLGWGLVRGERPRAAQWLGLALAASGLVGLTFPGIAAPDPVGAALMAVAGVAWGIYSLRGRGATRPLAANAGNFLRAVPFAFALLLLAGATVAATPAGIGLAASSGGIASGLGYSLWYAALPALTRTQAAVVQLCVPAVAAAAGVLLLGEPLTARTLIAGTAILGGVFIAVRPPRARD